MQPTVLRACGLVLVVATLLAVLTPWFAPGEGKIDLLAYWSGAHLLGTGRSPYDPAVMGEVQRAACWECVGADAVRHAWNPPWLMVLLLPLGAMPLGWAVPVWMFVNVLLVGGAALLTWTMLMPPPQGEDPRYERGMLAALLAAFAFGPVMTVLSIGQITTVLLFSLVLGLWLLRANYRFLAGMVFLFATIKPHLSYLLLCVAALWIVREREWRVLGGAVTAAVGTIALVTALYPPWFSDYLGLLNTLPYDALYASTLGSFVFHTTGFRGLQYAGLLLLPLALPLSTQAIRGDRSGAFNLALLLAVPLSPFGFSFDQVVLLPAIVQIVAWLWRRGKLDGTAALVAGGLVLLDLTLAVLQSIDGLPYYAYFATPLVLLALYMAAWRTTEWAAPTRV